MSWVACTKSVAEKVKVIACFITITISSMNLIKLLTFNKDIFYSLDELLKHIQLAWVFAPDVQLWQLRYPTSNLKSDGPIPVLFPINIGFMSSFFYIWRVPLTRVNNHERVTTLRNFSQSIFSLIYQLYFIRFPYKLTIKVVLKWLVVGIYF